MQSECFRTRFLFCLLLAVSLAVPGPVLAGPEEAETGDAMITMDFQDVELPVLVKFISELTGKNFILDEKVTGKKVTIISPTKISKEEAYRVFESILDIKGLTTVPSGRVIKILPTKDATTQSLKTVVGEDKTPVSDSLVTRLVPLKYVDSAEMAQILKPLMSRDSQIDAYGPTNTLIMTDTSSNIARLLRILKELDVEADEMIVAVIPLEYASADILATQLQEILETMNSPTAATTPTARTRSSMVRRPGTMRSTPTAPGVTSPTGGFVGKILPDDRTNSLIILSTVSQLKKVRELVQKLDYDTPRAYGNINVYYLEYSNAEDMAKVLTDLVSGAQTMGGTSGKQASSSPVATALARTMASFEGEVSITADVATNSLIVVAYPRDYQTIKNVIQKLDIRRKQVYVEAVIMEISPTFVQELGVELRGGIPLQSGGETDQVILGGTNFGMGTDTMFGSFASLAAGAAASGTTQTTLYPMQLGTQTGLTLGGVFDQIKIPTGDGKEITLPAQMFLIHAMQRTAKTNILSTPHLMAIDNEESEIVVGRNVPFITSTSQTTVSTVQQIQRENVGITLRFTPQITEGDYIQLELYQEISALIESPIGQDVNTVGPTTSTRKATNVVLVRDRQTIVVGGLMEDRIRTSKQKVPWLGDIPVLGWLFRYDSDQVDKNNLLIFLTPTIIREDQDVQRLFEEKKRNMLEYKKKHNITDKYLDVDALGQKQPAYVPPPPASEPYPLGGSAAQTAPEAAGASDGSGTPTAPPGPAGAEAAAPAPARPTPSWIPPAPGSDAPPDRAGDTAP